MILKYRLKRLYVKAVREKKPPEYIAKGWAIGMCVGCAIPFGVQLYISIPLSFYFKKGRVKVQVGLCRGKNVHDKRETLKKESDQRDIQRALRK